MSLDLVGLSLVVLGAVAGALAGALRQVVRLLALAAAALLAPRLAPRLAGPIERILSEPGAAAAVAVALAFALLFLLLWLLGRVVLRIAASEAERGAADRGFGALLGGLQALLAVWMAVSVLALWGRPLGTRSFRLDPTQGQLAGVVRTHNLLDLVAPADARMLRERLPKVREALESVPGGAAGAVGAAADAARKMHGSMEDRARDSKELLDRMEEVEKTGPGRGRR